ncbi:MAG: oxaloacetate decarboxylase, partial [Treponema sp.]|nr:oxaloacetate decarboxylase [Treponema sp.]
VHKDAGYVPLVTPTSQIVGTQAVMNVLMGRYKTMTQDFRNLITGKFGALPAEANQELVKKALEQNGMDKVMTCRPADEIPNEWDKMVEEAKKAGGNGSDEDVLTYAMFPNVAPKFFAERAKGPVDAATAFAKKEAKAPAGNGSYTVNVNGTPYSVTTNGDNITVNGQSYNVTFGATGAAPAAGPSSASGTAVATGNVPVPSPVAGTILKFVAPEGSQVKKGDTVIMIESMKMELEVKAPESGKISYTVHTGDQVQAGQTLGNLGGAPVAQPAPAAAPAQAAPAAAPASAGGKDVAAPVAGTLLRYAVAEGAAVQADTTIIIIESMKMELEIKAGAAGKVHFVAATGSQIAQGQTVAQIQ